MSKPKRIKCHMCNYITGTFHTADKIEKLQYHDDPKTGVCCPSSGRPLKVEKQPSKLALGLLNCYHDAITKHETEMERGTSKKLEAEAKAFMDKTRERLEQFIYELEQKAEK